MNTIFTEDKKFKEAIGAFIIAFSELEYGLADLGSMTEFKKKDRLFYKTCGFSIRKKS